jgi:hypothetical protein
VFEWKLSKWLNLGYLHGKASVRVSGTLGSNIISSGMVYGEPADLGSCDRGGRPACSDDDSVLFQRYF